MTKKQEQKDTDYLSEYADRKPWGFAASIDLKNCDLAKMTEVEYIKQFVKELYELIDRKRFGETVVVNFETKERVTGFSMIQFIETSLISTHFANASRTIYLDVFSCKEYSSYKVAEFKKKKFGCE